MAPDGLDSLDNLDTGGDIAEDNVLAIKPRGIGGADEELGAVGVTASVGHGEGTKPTVLEVEVLVLKLGAVDGLSARAVAAREVAALQHEPGDDAVDCGELEIGFLERFVDTALLRTDTVGVAKAFLTRAESAEVLGGLRNHVTA